MKQSIRKTLRRPGAALMAGLMAVSLLPAAALAAPVEAASSPSLEMARVIASAQVQENPFDFENDSDAKELEKAAQSFPESFDLRHCDTDGDGVYENYVTPVRLQNPFGTCWGFGAIAAAEISLLGSGLAQADGYGPVADPANGVKELNLSEKHLAYFTFTALNDRNSSQDGEGLIYEEGMTASDRFNTGGMMFYATELFASGIGPNLEDRSGLDAGDEGILTYKGRNGFLEFQRCNLDNKGNYKLTPVWYSREDDWRIPEDYRFYASYRLKESYELPSPAGWDDNYEYFYNEAGTNAIKEQLLAKRGVTIAFFADSSIPGKETDENSYISENWAHYTWEDTGQNHGVCIVGWDDNYPKENFNPEHQPPADGAWLVKNSWGAATNSDFAANGYRHWGMPDENGKATGYFWLSFYDQSLSDPEAFAFDKSNVGHSFYVEQYDMFPATSISELTVSTETGMANVFRAEGDSVLSQISFQTATPGVEVTYAVFLLKEGYDSPVHSDPVLTGSVTCPYGGYHKVTLPENQQVEMKQGQLFSVAVKEQTPSGSWAYVLPQAYSGELLKMLGIPSTPHCIINEGESYCYTDSAWHDMSDKSFASLLAMGEDLSNVDILSLLSDGGEDDMQYDNFPIKAYLEPVGDIVDSDIDPDLSRTAESAYDGKLKLSIGEDVLLYPDTETYVSARFFGAADSVTNPNQTVTWTSGNRSVFTVEPGIDPGNDGKKILKAGELGTATLTADAGPYGKETVTVSVERRKLDYVVLDSYQVTYTGEPIEPKTSTVLVSTLPDEGLMEAEEGKDFTLRYEDNILCGTAKAILVGAGDFEGQETTSDFYITPARPEITGVEPAGDGLTVRFASQKDSGIDGYELCWRAVGDGSGEAQTMELSADADSAVITGLEAGEIYTVSLRAFIKVEPDSEYSPDTMYGDFSVPSIVSCCAGGDACPAAAFTDLKPDAWYHDGIHWALDQGVMNGVAEGRFAPDGTTTRAMAATMIWRLAGEPESDEASSFTDVKDDAWYARAVNWAAEAGIVKGYSESVFAPDDNVTREQLATIIYRAVGEEIDFSFLEAILGEMATNFQEALAAEAANIMAGLPFEDVDAVSEWARDAVSWACDNGILNGKSATLLAPGDNAARAQVAAMLMRTSALFEEE